MELDIIILGAGCPNCERLERNARTAAAQLGAQATFSKSGDFDDYARYGILSTPGLVVDGRLVISGRVPPVDQIVALLADAMAGTGS